MRRTATATAAAAAILLLPALALGQEPVNAFDQLNTRLKIGNTIWVTDTEGREVKGRLTELHDASLVLDSSPGRVWKASEVRLIRYQRPDSKKNGIFIGMGAGFLGGWAFGKAWLEAQGSADGEEFAFAAIFAAVGAGAGAIIDAQIKAPIAVLYRAPGAGSAARLSVAPLITPRHKGIAVTFTF